MPTSLIGARIKALHERHQLPQEQLAQVFGFNDRQTVSAIENGTRRVTVEESLLAVETFHVSLRYFTDTFVLEPAEHLARVMEQDLGILALMADAELSISGATCRLPELARALIARAEVLGRRRFELAHELFHLLAWDAMPPRNSKQTGTTECNRLERLANNSPRHS